MLRIMHMAGLWPIYPGKNLSKPRRGATKYPYLLKDKTIWLPNQVWASDITYIRLFSGTVYLVSIIDVYFQEGTLVAAVEYDGYTFLHCSLGRSDYEVWSSEYFQ